MSTTTIAFSLVTACFLALAVGTGLVMRWALAENRRLTNELILNLRRATMPIMQVGGAVGEEPMTPEQKAFIDAALNVDGRIDPQNFLGVQGGINGYTVDEMAAKLDAGRYPDPTDGGLPNPAYQTGAERVSVGDDPFWPGGTGSDAPGNGWS